MMEAQCAVAETANRGAEPGLAEVKNYFTRLENRKQTIAKLLNTKVTSKLDYKWTYRPSVCCQDVFFSVLRAPLIALS